MAGRQSGVVFFLVLFQHIYCWAFKSRLELNVRAYGPINKEWCAKSELLSTGSVEVYLINGKP